MSTRTTVHPVQRPVAAQHPAAVRRPNLAAVGRRLLWRCALTLTGGLRVHGDLPAQPCVLVANHTSHADTAALVAALPARRRPAVAAAADYWFTGPARAVACQALAGAVPVRRGGGGSADLAATAALLTSGRDVIVYPEGSRSRDGDVGEFHRGAQRLAASAGAPLVPVGIAGTRDVLPVHGRLARARVSVRFGAPVADLATARTAIVELSTEPDASAAPPLAADSALRRAVAGVDRSRVGSLAMFLWAFAEAVSWPLLPEFALVALVVAAPRRVGRLALAATAGSLIGAALTYLLAAHGWPCPRR